MNSALTIESISNIEARVAGRIDVDNAAQVLSRGAAMFAGQRMTVDVVGLQSADSVTLAVLLAWVERAQNSGGVLIFKGISSRLRAIAHLSDVEPLLGISQSGASATAV
ncbi:MAG: STAS domain-containing protein [Dokdonella sp.]